MSKYKSKTGQNVVNSLFSDEKMMRFQAVERKELRGDAEQATMEELKPDPVPVYKRNYVPDTRVPRGATSNVEKTYMATRPDRLKK